MKQLHLLFITVLTIGTILLTNAQTDVTDQIVNPSFEEDGTDLNGDPPTGWTWIGNDGYAWVGVNTDAEDTAKTGDYISGTWNGSIGDVELSQTISGLDNGIYEVTCDLMGGSSNASGSRMTTQRLFATSGGVTKSMLYGADTASVYTEANLSVLSLDETYSFGGFAEFTSDRTPFETLSVEIEVSDGSLTIGVRTNGKDNQMGFDFSDTGIFSAADGHGWFKVDNFTLTYLGGTGIEKYNENNSIEIILDNGFITIPDVEEFEIYNISGSKMPVDKQLGKGIYIIKANEKFKKIVVH